MRPLEVRGWYLQWAASSSVSQVFTVVGVFEEEAEEDEQHVIYIPLHAQMLMRSGGRIDDMTLSVGDATASSRHAPPTRSSLSWPVSFFAADDKQALRFWIDQEMNEEVCQKLFVGIGVFVWIIGLGTILAGVVGVSNIMLISVQERTRAIGVRRRFGSRPSSILADGRRRRWPSRWSQGTWAWSRRSPSWQPCNPCSPTRPTSATPTSI